MSLYEQLPHAYNTYADISNVADHTPVSFPDFEAAYRRTEASWQAPGRALDLLSARAAGTFVLTATPGIALTGAQLLKLPHHIGVSPEDVLVEPEFYSHIPESEPTDDPLAGALDDIGSSTAKPGYTPKQLSGSLRWCQAIHFGIIDSLPEPDLRGLSANAQLDRLDALQQQFPGGHYRIPRPLETIAYWMNLYRAGQDINDASSTIWHVDMPGTDPHSRLYSVVRNDFLGPSVQIMHEPLDSRRLPNRFALG